MFLNSRGAARWPDDEQVDVAPIVEVCRRDGDAADLRRRARPASRVMSANVPLPLLRSS